LRVHNCPNCGIALRKFEDFTFGNVTVSRTGEIVLDGEPLAVMPTVRMILDALIRAEGRVLSRSVLIDILDVDARGENGIRAIDVYVKRARRALEVILPDFDQIATVRGIGYRWDRREPTELLMAA
jgi:DNA-binding response OmpR family regulator